MLTRSVLLVVFAFIVKIPTWDFKLSSQIVKRVACLLIYGCCLVYKVDCYYYYKLRDIEYALFFNVTITGIILEFMLAIHSRWGKARIDKTVLSLRQYLASTALSHKSKGASGHYHNQEWSLRRPQYTLAWQKLSIMVTFLWFSALIVRSEVTFQFCKQE